MKLDTHYNKTWIRGLSLQCPLGCADGDCPLNTLRHLPSAQMNQTINELPRTTIDAILQIHHECCRNRIKQISRTGTARRAHSRGH